MTINELRLAIPSAISAIDSLITKAYDLRTYIEDTSPLIDEANPLEATISAEQIATVIAILQAKKSAVDAEYSALDLSNFQ